MKYAGFVGQAYKLDKLSVNAQRCVNMYLEFDESGSPKEQQPAFLRPTDGIKKLFESSNPTSVPSSWNGRTRCLTENSKHRILFVTGDVMNMARLDHLGEWSVASFGQHLLETASGVVISATSDPGDSQITVFVDGVNSYLYKQDAAFPDADGDFKDFQSWGYEPVLKATHVAFLDGFFIFNEIDTNIFKASGYQSLNVDPLDFASSEGDPDKLMGLIVCNRQLWLMNEKSTEVWASSGNADFPFERIQGGFIEKGCSARYSIAKEAGLVFWLDNAGSVQMAAGLSPKRISTHAIEQAIASYKDRSTATAYAYTKAGHTFYVINFAETSWAYDVATGAWHERAYKNANGDLEPHRASCLVQSTFYNTTFVGDRENNKIYALDSAFKDDDGAEIKRLRSSPCVSSEGTNVFHHAIEFDVEAGVGLDGEAEIQDANPEVMLRYSDDNARSWSNERRASIGRIGEFDKRVIFRRLGKSRRRVYELSFTSKTDFAILGANIDLEKGVS